MILGNLLNSNVAYMYNTFLVGVRCTQITEPAYTTILQDNAFS
jgi:hypothetical protein